MYLRMGLNRCMHTCCQLNKALEKTPNEWMNKWSVIHAFWMPGSMVPPVFDRESWLCHPPREGLTWCLNRWFTHQYEQPLILNSTVTLDLSITYLHTQLSLYSFPRCCGSSLGLEMSKEFDKGALVRYCHQWSHDHLYHFLWKVYVLYYNWLHDSPYDLNAHYSQPGEFNNQNHIHGRATGSI